LDDRQVPHRGDDRHVTGAGDVVHPHLAGENRGAVHAHPAGAANHHPTALAVRERAVVLVLDDVEAVEQRRLLLRADLEFLELALPGPRVETPDLQPDLHAGDPSYAGRRAALLGCRVPPGHPPSTAT